MRDSSDRNSEVLRCPAIQSSADIVVELLLLSLILLVAKQMSSLLSAGFWGVQAVAKLSDGGLIRTMLRLRLPALFIQSTSFRLHNMELRQMRTRNQVIAGECESGSTL